MNTKTLSLPSGILASFNDYLALIRFKFHPNFGFVIAGAVSFTEVFDLQFFSSLLLLYVSFNICLYGGIYTINALTDLEKDAQHPRKCNRPLPSGRISKAAAIELAIILITLGLLVGFFYFGTTIGMIYLAFIGVNLFYSLVARQIPYIELFVNASTMPLRMLLGVLMVTNEVIPVGLIIGAFCLGIGFLTIRRIVEKDVAGWEEGRPALQAYQGNIMQWIQLAGGLGLLITFYCDPLRQNSIFAFVGMLLTYLIMCLGVHVLPPIRRYWLNIYTN
jgi:4-hydroxybenzoate polyprenyltransferase